MKLRTKMKLKFYLSLAGLVLLTVAIGIFFEYVVWLGWKFRLGLPTIPWLHFIAMAIALLILTISDIVLFFYLIFKRRHW